MPERVPLGANFTIKFSKKLYGASMYHLNYTRRCLTKRQINLVLANSRMIKVSSRRSLISWSRNFWFFAFNYCKRPLVVFS